MLKGCPSPYIWDSFGIVPKKAEMSHPKQSAQKLCLLFICHGSSLFLYMLEFTHKKKVGQHFIMTLFPQSYFLQGVGCTFYMMSSYGCAITSE